MLSFRLLMPGTSPQRYSFSYQRLLSTLSASTSKKSDPTKSDKTTVQKSTTDTNVIQSDVTIVGGGLVGAALACALQTNTLTSHLHISLIDSSGVSFLQNHDKLGIGLRQSTFTGTSKRLLESVGVWEELGDGEKKGERGKEDVSLVGKFERMVVWDGESCLTFGGSENGMGWVVDNEIVRRGLWRKILGGGIEVVVGEVADVDVGDEERWTSVSVRGEKDVVIKGRLTVGADGGRSVVREKANLGWVCRRVGRAVVANIRAEGIEGIAWQRFLEDSGVLAVLPMSTKGWANVIWSTNDIDARLLMGLDDATFVDELNTAIQGKSGNEGEAEDTLILDSEKNEHAPFPVAKNVMGKKATFPLVVGHAPEYVDANKRVALVGDAAHCVHPLAGQGVNMGFADVVKLVDCIAEGAATGRDFGTDTTLLQKYQSDRMIRNVGMISLLQGLKTTFGTNWTPLKMSRRLGLSALNQIAPVKDLMMKAMT